MSFVAVAATVVGEGLGATLLGGAMMGASFTGVNNLVHGRNPFDNIAQGALMGAATAGIAPEVGAELAVSAPTAAGITAGGLTAIQTKGDLGKSIMAGMSAYGLAGLSQNMQKVGETSLGNTATSDLAATNANTASQQSLAESNAYNANVGQSNAFTQEFNGANTLPGGQQEFNPVQSTPLSANEISARAGQAAEQAGNATSRVTPETTAGERALAGRQSISDTGVGKFLKNNATNLMYAAGPILTDTGNTPKLPSAAANNSMIRRFSYDPYSGTYTPQGSYKASLDKGMASGGITGLANGGAVAFAGGGATDNTEAIKALYANNATAQAYNPTGPDAAATAYWNDQINKSGLAAIQGGGFSSAVNAYAAANPMAQQQAAAQQPAAATGLASLGAAGDVNYMANAPKVITDTNQYFAQNPDVAAAYKENSYGMTPEAFAQTHYDKYGSTEQRVSPLTANTNANAYLAANPDVAKEYTANSYGMTPAQVAAYHDTNYGAAEQRAAPVSAAQAQVENMYRNVLGRDPDPTGLKYWTDAINAGRSPEQVYKEFLTSAKSLTNLVDPTQIKNMSYADATKAYAGAPSSDTTTMVDEWARNLLGREPTAADKEQSWYKNAAGMTTQTQAQDMYGQFQSYATQQKIADAKAQLDAKGITDADVLRQTGKTIAQLVAADIGGTNFVGASQLQGGAKQGFDFGSLTKPKTVATSTSTLPAGVGGDQTTVNPNGTLTTRPNIPGFGDDVTGMGQVKNIYTQGGGSTGYVPYAPKTMADFNTAYNKTSGDTAAMYDYLTGKTKEYPTSTVNKEIMRPYSEAVMGIAPKAGRPTQRYIWDQTTQTRQENPNWVPTTYDTQGIKHVGLSSVQSDYLTSHASDSDAAIYAWAKASNIPPETIAEQLGKTLAEVKTGMGVKGAAPAAAPAAIGGDQQYAQGGMTQNYAGGGLGSLGGYSDGGQLLKGPGDGVSDSIPASIGDKQPARLADGEFVVPARIVSELGNGSTDAGARKLYQMMDRVQNARGKTTGKNRVATNTRADKYLPV
jgi:hypothetical protein